MRLIVVFANRQAFEAVGAFSWIGHALCSDRELGALTQPRRVVVSDERPLGGNRSSATHEIDFT
jgi:hypothetical protein